jgi:hypothetical protein
VLLKLLTAVQCIWEIRLSPTVWLIALLLRVCVSRFRPLPEIWEVRLSPTVLLMALLLRVWEVPGSNLGPETFPELGYLCFLSVPLDKYRDSQSRYDYFLPHPFQFVIYESSFQSMLYRLRYW